MTNKLGTVVNLFNRELNPYFKVMSLKPEPMRTGSCVQGSMSLLQEFFYVISSFQWLSLN